MEILGGEGLTDSVQIDVRPGSEYRYSGGGYLVMQQLVEDVSGSLFHELMQLAKYWAELELDLTYSMASTGTIGSDWLRKTSFAGRRLGRIERALGGDEVDEIVTRVREQFAATVDPELWKLFCDGRREELQRIVWESVEQGQAKRHLSRQGVPSGE